MTAVNRPKRTRRLGRLAFFIPTIVILILVVVAFVTVLSVQSGTLVVYAESSGRYAPSVALRPTVTVGSVTRISPFNLTLSQGEYTVTYGPLEWYATPSARSIFVSNGRTQFAAGVYSPIIRTIAITQSGFNMTAVTAMHGVTPVVWLNEGGSSVVLEIHSLRYVTLNPSQNFTFVFPSGGTFSFDVPNTSFNGTVVSR